MAMLEAIKSQVTGPEFDNRACNVAIAADGKFFVAKGRSIHVYSESGQYQRVCYTTQTDDGYYLACITITKDGRIIAGDYARSIITLRLHTPDGKTLIMKTINTSIRPQGITAINNTHVAIRQLKYQANKVCVIDLDSGEETLSIDIDRTQAIAMMRRLTVY